MSPKRQTCSNTGTQSYGSLRDRLAAEECKRFGLFGGILTVPTFTVEGGLFFFAIFSWGIFLVVTESCPEQMTTEHLQEGIGAFKDFSAGEIEDAMAFFEHVSLAPGAELWPHGDGKKFAGFILSGKVAVRKRINDSRQHVILGVYGAGSMIGELSLLSESPPTLSAKALEHTELIVIENHRFMELLERKPLLGLSLIKQIYLYTANRLDKSYDRLTSMF